MADLSSLFQYAPTVAAGFMGINQKNDELKAQADRENLASQIADRQARLAMEQEYQPYEVEKRRLANQKTVTEMPGIEADAQGKVLKTQKARDTYQTDVAAANAKNTGEVEDEKLKKMDRAHQFMLSAGAELSNVPVPLRAARLKQLMDDNGMKSDAPGLSDLLRMDPIKIPDAMQAFAQRIGDQKLSMNPAARAQMYTADQHRLASKYTADQHLAGTQYTANQATARANAKMQKSQTDAKTVLENAISGKLSVDKALAAASMGEALSESHEEKMMWRNVGARLMDIAQNKVPPKPTIDENGNIVTPAARNPFREDQKPRGTGTKDDPIVLK